MKVGAVVGKGTQIDLETGEIGLHSTPTIAKYVILVGSSFREGLTVKTHNNTKGLVRAYDVKSGKLLWTFNTIPRPGEFGNDTWEKSRGRRRQHRRVDADHRRRRAGLHLPVKDPTFQWRTCPAQPVRRQPGLRRPEDRPPSGTSRSCTTRSGYDMPAAPPLADIVAAPETIGGRAVDQAGFAVRVRSRHRPAGVAD
jgi:hypothetical protein